MRFLFQWVPEWQCSPRWMAFSHYSASRNKRLYVAFPLNLAVAAAWWIQDRWARAANAPSWIEREVRHRLDHHRRSTSSRHH